MVIVTNLSTCVGANFHALLRSHLGVFVNSARKKATGGCKIHMKCKFLHHVIAHLQSALVVSFNFV